MYAVTCRIDSKLAFSNSFWQRLWPAAETALNLLSETHLDHVCGQPAAEMAPDLLPEANVWPCLRSAAETALSLPPDAHFNHVCGQLPKRL